MKGGLIKKGDRVKVLSTNGIGSICEVIDSLNILTEYDEEYEYLSPRTRLYNATISDIERLTKEPKKTRKINICLSKRY